MLKLCASTGLLIAACTVSAQTYFKCTNASGRVELSNTACADNSRGEPMQIRSNSMDYSASREGALKQENESLRSQLANAERDQAGQAGRNQQGQQSDKSRSLECKQAQRSYESETSSLQPKKAQIQALRSAMFIACGTQEPEAVQATPSRRTVCSTTGTAIYGNYSGTTVCR
jgi:hypothetical protein